MRSPPTAPVPGVSYIQGARNAYYRVSLPALVNGQQARDGTWDALLSLDMEAWTAGDNSPQLFSELRISPLGPGQRTTVLAARPGLPYLSLVADASEDSWMNPGRRTARACFLTVYGIRRSTAGPRSGQT